MRDDPYYPPQDPLWPAFERFLRGRRRWRAGWNFSEGREVWWPFWEAFLAGAAARAPLDPPPPPAPSLGK